MDSLEEFIYQRKRFHLRMEYPSIQISNKNYEYGHFDYKMVIE